MPNEFGNAPAGSRAARIYGQLVVALARPDTGGTG
jgi:hypothetical protein